MKNEKLAVLVVARPGIMRNSLISYLRAIPLAPRIVLADDVSQACRAIAEHKPGLAVLDADLSEVGILDLIQHITIEQPSTRVIVLAASMRQQEVYANRGVKHVLLKGFLDEQLREAVLSAIEAG